MICLEWSPSGTIAAGPEVVESRSQEIIGAPGFEPVTTHMFVAGDEYLDSDAVFGVKGSLVVPFIPRDDASGARKLGLANPCYTAEHDFTLVRKTK